MIVVVHLCGVDACANEASYLIRWGRHALKICTRCKPDVERVAAAVGMPLDVEPLPLSHPEEDRRLLS